MVWSRRRSPDPCEISGDTALELRKDITHPNRWRSREFKRLGCGRHVPVHQRVGHCLHLTGLISHRHHSFYVAPRDNAQQRLAVRSVQCLRLQRHHGVRAVEPAGESIFDLVFDHLAGIENNDPAVALRALNCTFDTNLGGDNSSRWSKLRRRSKRVTVTIPPTARCENKETSAL